MAQPTQETDLLSLAHYATFRENSPYSPEHNIVKKHPFFKKKKNAKSKEQFGQVLFKKMVKENLFIPNRDWLLKMQP